MTLAIAFKGTEGVVLAADSRVTISAVIAGPNGTQMSAPAHYDNATKLLKVQGQDHVAAVTFGLGTLGSSTPRTAHSFLPEFEAELAAQNCGRLSVYQFAEELGAFFSKQHAALHAGGQTDDMHFLVGGYDEDEPYGRVYEVSVPSNPTPIEKSANDFGITISGQNDIAGRALSGMHIPYQFLPLQDCIDLSVVLIRMTVQLQQFAVGLRGVGGHIDVAIVTRQKGYQDVQVKNIRGLE